MPWREETRACCFWPRELKSEDLPTLGLPIKAILSGTEVDLLLLRAAASKTPVLIRRTSEYASFRASFFSGISSILTTSLELAYRVDKIAALRSLIPCPVVAETRKVWAGLMPRRRNSSSGRDSPRSDLLSRSKTGLRERRADLAISLSR